MKLNPITDKEFDLKSAVIEKYIFPTELADVTVLAYHTKLIIDFHNLSANYGEPDEVVVFFWDYSGEKPFVARCGEMTNHHIYLEADTSLMFQMILLQIESVRVGVAFRFGNQCFCGYCRNGEAKREGLQVWDRSICKLGSMDKAAFVAYWTESGILSVRFRDEKKFDDDFYWIKLCGYLWECGKLTVYLEAPLMAGELKIGLYSMSTQAACREAAIEVERAGDTGLKSVWKMTMDFTKMSADDSDGYRLLGRLSDHMFQVLFDGETAEDDSCKIALESGGELEVCVVKNADGQFILKTGHVYPVMLSIVTAVYNTAPFLPEMINSVLSQKTENLEEYCRDYRRDYYRHIMEFILVDDGSTDGSGDILDDYARISDKIKVIHKENGGVSSARNAGLEVAKGKYINFADSDDRLSENFVEECLLFFEQNNGMLTVVKTPMKFFDALKADHWANYQFNRNNRIVNPFVEPNIAFHNVNSCVLKLTDLRERRFDTALSIGEDMLFVNETMIAPRDGAAKELKVGLVGKACYYYRKRSSGADSAMDQNRSNADAYMPVLENVYERILLYSKEKYGYIPKWIQYSVMGQLQWRFSANDAGRAGKELLGESVYYKYKEKAFSLLQYIDDDVIMAQKKIWNEHKFFMLQKKYKSSLQVINENNDLYFEINKTRISTPLGRCYIKLEFFDISEDNLHIEGFAMNYMQEAELLIYVNGKTASYQVDTKRDVNKYSFDEIVFFATPFSADIPVDKKNEKYEISFYGRLSGVEVEKSDFRFAKTMPLAQTYKKSFFGKKGWIARKENNSFILYNSHSLQTIAIDFEKEFEQEIIAANNKDSVREILELRKQAMFLQTDKVRKIWLVSDRIYSAGDNGEAMFRYISANPDSDVEAYFIIDSNSPDFARMQNYGKVVPYGSKQHYLLHLIADCIISSAADEFVINPWFDNPLASEVVRDLLAKPEFIFLQHGITQNDLSDWLNRYNKKITGFVCATQREAQSILDYKYFYKAENVWLTGFPRHDRLYNNEKKYITIMPTWRKWLVEGKLNNPNENFDKSEYFAFYNKLINYGRLLDSAYNYGYTICFMPHPIIQQAIGKFDRDLRVIFSPPEKTYREVYAESNLIITDYSSACIDFAILKKPIVYCQFDEKQFFEQHTVKHGYFDYLRDGFGELTFDMDSLVDVIIMYMKNGCKMYEPYKERVNGFFAFHDLCNCERVYQKIKGLFSV